LSCSLACTPEDTKGSSAPKAAEKLLKFYNPS
jgi:hypothetical protein